MSALLNEQGSDLRALTNSAMFTDPPYFDPHSFKTMETLEHSDTSANQSNLDHTGADYSFLRARSASSCSQMAQTTGEMYGQARTPSQSAALVGNSLPGTPRKQTPSSQSSTPTVKTSLHRAQSQHRRRMLESISLSRRSTPASSAARSYSAKTTARFASKLAYTKRLPLRLPRPPICVISDPDADLCRHLQGHGMGEEARQLASAQDIPVNYVLHALVDSSVGGAIALLNQTSVFLDTHAAVVQGQIAKTSVDTEETVPPRICIPISDLDPVAEERCLTPTHLLAIQGTQDSEEDTRGLLLPCHGLMYILRCVSLPSFGMPSSSSSSSAIDGDDKKRTLPTVLLRVPRPSDFPVVHRYIYTHDASALLIELLPMRHVARHLESIQEKRAEASASSTLWSPEQALGSSSALPTVDMSTPSNSATDALSHLPIQSLFGYACKIHSTWANGLAIGLLDSTFWSTLDRAWSLVIAALACKKARIIDTENRGVTL